MRKQLPTDGIANELAGSSVFFPNGEVEPTVLSEPAPPAEPMADTQGSMPSTNQPTTVAGNHATVPPRQQEGAPASAVERLAPGDVETIRRVVRQVGKEAATYRLTPEEKSWLGEQVYRMGQRKCRTSENEIARIALNWLRHDHQAHGPRSVLARLLDALHR